MFGCICLCSVMFWKCRYCEIVQQSGEEGRAMSQLWIALHIYTKCSMMRSLNIPITCLNLQPLSWHGLDSLFAGLSQDPRVPRWRSHQQWLLGLVRFLARFRLKILYHLLRLHSLLNGNYLTSAVKKTPLFMQKSDGSWLFTLTLSLKAICFVSWCSQYL